MKFQINGLVLRESCIGDNDKIVTLLTSEQGLINVLVRGAKSIRSSKVSTTQLFAYSNFVLYKSNKGYIVDDGSVKEIFFGLRNDIKKLALAQYFCEISLALSPHSGDAGEFLRIILNSLYYIEKEKKDNLIIKSIFEMRMCSISGYMPNLVGCSVCGCHDAEIMYFLIEEGIIKCGTCCKGADYRAEDVSKGVLMALRHIIYSPVEKIFNFSISQESLKRLSLITERYIVNHIDINFKALRFYKDICV